MDLREVSNENIERHPWELSRTRKIMDVCKKTLADLHLEGDLRIANIGAGDTYFDQCYLSKFPADFIYAVDTGYDTLDSDATNIQKVHDLSLLSGETMLDAVFMMDSLEYMPDDAAYLRTILEKVKPGGKLIFTLPAFQFLFSDHDIHVENLRRYSITSFKKTANHVPSLKVLDHHYFYCSLFCVRFLKKILHLPIDKDQKITAAWKYGRKNIITVLLTACLNLDYQFCKVLHFLKIYIPGLSLLVVCEKER